MMMALGMAGCQSTKLSKDFDEKEVKAKAEMVIEKLNAGEYDNLKEEEFSEQMKLAMAGNEVKESIEKIVEEKGTFQSFEKGSVLGSKDKDTDEEFATAVVLAKYEKGKIQYTISFNKEMKVSGFYLK